MNLRVLTVAPSLFGSGACALIYQVAWSRQMRLIFAERLPTAAAF
jgi:spermidine synthase